MKTDSSFLRHGPCDKCGSSDANAIYSDGHTYCYNCNTFVRDSEGEPMNTPVQQQTVVPLTAATNVEFKEIADRKLSLDTCKKYGVKINSRQHNYPYCTADGIQVATKTRILANKTFPTSGNISEAVLFGQSLFPTGGKSVTITEGELDAMSVFEMNGRKYPAVSVRNASTALSDCRKSFEWLDGFNEIVLCFDNDAAGKKATEQVAQLFEPNKCKIVDMALKDASEYLVMGKREDFINRWFRAETYTPAGIINLKELGDALYEEKNYESILYPWSGLNNKLYGMRTGELVTFTSGTGMGKSSIIRELSHHILKNSEHNIGLLALEENIKQTAFNMMSVEANKRLYIKEEREKLTREELKVFEDATINTGRFFAFDHFGSIGNDEILSRVRFMAKVLDCKWVFLDHLSILVSGQEQGDERKGIDVLMTKLRSLVEETGIGLFLVSHLRRASGDKGHEEGVEVSLSHLRGSQSIAQLSDAVIAGERNQQDEDDIKSNTTTIRVLKNRYAGETGIGTYLYYDRETGRMSEISNPYKEQEEADANPFTVVEEPIFDKGE